MAFVGPLLCYGHPRLALSHADKGHCLGMVMVNEPPSASPPNGLRDEQKPVSQ